MSNMALQKIVFTSNSVGYSCSFKGRNFILMKIQGILGSCFAVHIAKLPDKISTSASFVNIDRLAVYGYSGTANVQGKS